MTLDYRVEPLTDFTIFTHTPSTRDGVRFSAKWTQTLKDLARELDYLDASDVVLELAVQPHHVLKSGVLSARVPKDLPHPGVRLSFDTRNHGRMSFSCDTYQARWHGQMPDWQANVRAIMLTLESLRAVGRHGATQGEEYAGFKAIGAGPGTGIALGGMTRDEAVAILAEANGIPAEHLNLDPATLRHSWRRARREAHPDRHAGSREAWDQVEQAAKVLGLS